MNEIEKLRLMYNTTQNSQEKQCIAEKIDSHIKNIEKQVVVMKANVDKTIINMDLLWEQRTALYNILHKQEKNIPSLSVEEQPKNPHQINMLKRSVDTQSVSENISAHIQPSKAPENIVTSNAAHAVLIVEIYLPHKWLYDYKITQLSKHIKNNRCIVKIDLDSVPQQHIHITEESGVKSGYVDIYVNVGVDKIYNIRITSDYSRIARDMRDMVSVILSVIDSPQLLLVGIMCGIRTSFRNVNPS